MACESQRDKNRRKADYRAYMLEVARTRAKAVGRECSITLDDIVVPTHCPLLGIPLRLSGDRGHRPSLDRKDNAIDYVKGNVFVISQRANSLKGGLSVEQLAMFAHNLLAYIGKP
ncbi:hypothetical protein GCM10023185_31030 [Hymenobacter saemangeumensis]|uniref:Uncharacterized protein n=2 Tax=Hymenobacter saemangeumensis TaxID=1084522 RepID=A0ABP8ILW5_9BACT